LFSGLGREKIYKEEEQKFTYVLEYDISKIKTSKMETRRTTLTRISGWLLLFLGFPFSTTTRYN